MPDPIPPKAPEKARARKSDRLGIVRERHPYDDGYWRRFDGMPRPHGPPETLQGWKDCDEELSFEAACRRGPKSEERWHERRAAR